MNDIESIMRANKDNSKAFIYCWFMQTYCSHKRTLYIPESLCMYFFSAMLYNVDARLLLFHIRQCWDRQHKRDIEIAAVRQVIKSEQYEYAANRRVHGPECSLILGLYCP